MRPVSQRFLAALRQSHSIVATVDLYFPGTGWLNVPVIGGELTFDRTAVIRRNGSVQVPWSLQAGVDLGVNLRALPLGGYASISRGVRFPDGTSEYARLGVYRVESVTWLTVEDQATIELADRMAQVRDEPFTAPFAVAGKRVAAAAAEVVSGVFGGGIAYHTIYDPPIFITDTFYSGNRDDALTKLAQSIGGEAYFDADGNYVFDGAPGTISITRNGTLTDDSPRVTGLSQTSDLVSGMTVYGVGLPPGRRILTIDSASQITLNGPVNTRGQKNARGVAGSPVLTKISDTTDLTPGMVVTGPGAQAGTTLRSVDGPDQITLSKPVTATSVDYEFLYVFTVPNPVQLVFTGASGNLTAPVWLIDTGDRGVMLNAEEALDRTGIYNGVLVEGQADASDVPVSALVVDNNPSSLTYWGGPFGRVVRIEQSSAVQTATQAQQAAQALLSTKLGLTRSLVLTAAPNPALEPGDTIRVRFVDGRDELHTVDAIRLDLGPEGAQELTTRSVFTPASSERQVPMPRRPFGVYYGRSAWLEARKGRRRREALTR
ncbi:MAG TPA: DUF5047 domain-containing protein [Thermomicrobiales bacterium]|jgi:hypothetical protein